MAHRHESNRPLGIVTNDERLAKAAQATDNLETRESKDKRPRNKAGSLITVAPFIEAQETPETTVEPETAQPEPVEPVFSSPTRADFGPGGAFSGGKDPTRVQRKK